MFEGCARGFVSGNVSRIWQGERAFLSHTQHETEGERTTVDISGCPSIMPTQKYWIACLHLGDLLGHWLVNLFECSNGKRAGKSLTKRMGKSNFVE